MGPSPNPAPTATGRPQPRIRFSLLRRAQLYYCAQRASPFFSHALSQQPSESMPPVLDSVRAVCAVLLLLLSAVAVRAGDVVGLGSRLTDLCKFMVDGYTYDICPIVQRNGGAVTFTDTRATPPTVTEHHYHISFGGPLRKTERHAEEEQVRPDAASSGAMCVYVRPRMRSVQKGRGSA